MAGSHSRPLRTRSTLSQEEALELLFSLPDVSDSDQDADSDDDPDWTDGKNNNASVSAVSLVDNCDSSSSDEDRPPAKRGPRQVHHSTSKKRQVPNRSDDESDCDEPVSGWVQSVTSQVWNHAFADVARPTEDYDPETEVIDFFSRYFSDAVFEHMVEQTNLYASQTKVTDWTATTEEELRAFLGVLIKMALIPRTSYRLYWSSDPELGVPSVSAVMTLRRFQKLLQAFHLNDNTKNLPRTDPNHDKLYRIRPLIDELGAAFLRELSPSSFQSVDECMVLFKGRSSLKQYMPMKPTKRGYKVWARADAPCGYLCQFEVYCGKAQPASDAVTDGLGPRVVKDLSATLKHQNKLVVFYNFFTTAKLMDDLYEDGIIACGTVRTNRKGLPAELKAKNKLEKGEHIWFVKGNCAAIQWRDTKHVNMLTTSKDPRQTTSVNRTQKDGTKATISCPEAVVEYTKYMRGVDMFDQLREQYSVSRRAMKWWHRLFYFLLDSALVDAYILHKLSRKEVGVEPYTHFQFLLKLSRELVGSFTSRKKKGPASTAYLHKRRRTSLNTLGVPDEVRFTDVGRHMPEALNTFRRCRFCSTKAHDKRSKIGCTTCKVPLCAAPCFALFHAK
ncbi:piggyBac transposable element-derived protein 4-like [Ornithodoros turicata]|uniref:piggyBac transposable element-derived protein 4-like n=1 Tax=Ornithodoros turicata TaxID=34597 RepID=UPI003138F963